MKQAMDFFHVTGFVKAVGMILGDYNQYRGWRIPEDENPADTGFLVEDSAGVPNHPDHNGRIRWVTTEEFHRTFKLLGTMDFSDALLALKSGMKVARMGWNGKGMFLYLVPGSTFQVNRAPLLGIYPAGHTINYLPHIDMRTADGSCVPWLASQTDLLASDWTPVL